MVRYPLHKGVVGAATRDEANRLERRLLALYIATRLIRSLNGGVSFVVFFTQEG